MGNFDIGPRIGVDGEPQFREAIESSANRIKVLTSELRVVTSEFGKNEKSVESLTAKNKILAQIAEEQRKKLDGMKDALAAATEKYGESDKATQKWQQVVNNATAELNKMERELVGNEQAIKNLNEEAKKKALEEYAAQAQKLGDIANNALNVGLKAATATCATLGAAAVAGVVALTNLSKSAGEFADDLLTTSAKTGVSAKALQEWTYAARFIDTEVGTMTGTMAKLIKNMESARNGSKTQAEAFQALNVEYKDTNGLLRDSQTVYWEAIDALGRMSNETQRDATAMQIFGKSAQELNPLIKAGSAAVADYAAEAQRLGLIISDETLASLGEFDDTMQRIDAQMEVLGRRTAVSVIDPMMQAGGAVSSSIAKITQSLESGALKSAARNISNAIGSIVARAADTADRWIPKLVNGFVWLTENGGKLVAVLLTVTTTLATFKAAMAVAQAVQTATTALAAFRAAQVAATAATSSATVATTGLNAAMAANPITLVISLIAALAAGILTYVLTAEKAAGETDNFKSAMQSAADSAASAQSAFDDTAASAMAAESMAGSYINRLAELEAAGLGSNAAQAEYAEIVSRLNVLIPGLNATISEQTGLIEGGTEALRRQVQAWRENAIAQAAEEQMTAAYKAHAAASIELYKAEAQLAAKQAELTKKQQEQAAIVEKIAQAAGYSKKEFDALSSGQRANIIATSSLSASYGLLTGEILRINGSIAEWKDAVQSGTVTVDELASALDLTAEAAQQYYGALSDSTATEAFAGNSDIAESAAKDLSAAIDSMSEKAVNSFDRMSKGSKLSIEQMIKNLSYNAEAMETWAENIKILAERGVDDGLLAKLKEMGPDARLLVKEMVDATDAELAELEAAFAKAGDAAASAAYAAGANAGNALASGLESTIHRIKAAAHFAADTVPREMQMTMKIESPSKRGIWIGKMWGEGVVIGLEEMVQRAASVARRMAQHVESATAAVSGARLAVTDGVSSFVPAAAGGMNITSSLTVNTPKAMNASEIARENRNMLWRIKWQQK